MVSSLSSTSRIIIYCKLLQAIAGTLLVGIASGIYLIANLGPGPRDGLMTGFQRATESSNCMGKNFFRNSCYFNWLVLGGQLVLQQLFLHLGLVQQFRLAFICISANIKK